MLIVGVVVIALFVWRQLVIDNPMLELHVFKYPVFSLSVILGSIVTMAMIGAEIVLPLYIQTIRGSRRFNQVYYYFRCDYYGDNESNYGYYFR